MIHSVDIFLIKSERTFLKNFWDQFEYYNAMFVWKLLTKLSKGKALKNIFFFGAFSGQLFQNVIYVLYLSGFASKTKLL